MISLVPKIGVKLMSGMGWERGRQERKGWKWMKSCRQKKW